MDDERREQWRNWLSAFAVAGGLHMAAVAALFIGPWQTTIVSAAAKSAPLAVELASLPAAPIVPPTDVPIAERIQEVVPERSARQPKPQRQLPAAVPARKADAAPPTPEQTQPQTAEPETSLAPNVAPSDEPVSKAPVAGAATHPSDNPALAWESQVLAQLERAKRYPNEARWQRQQDTVYIDLVVGRDGRLLSARISASAGYVALDDEVLDLVKRAAPLPAPPPEVVGDRIALRVPVEFYLAKR